MTRLEDDLRISLRAHALDLGPDAVPSWEPPRRNWTSRPWFVPAVAAASALVFVAGAGLAVIALTSAPDAVTPAPLTTASVQPSPSASASTPAAPAGKKPVSYRGVQVLVPAEFEVAAETCDGYPGPSVVVGKSTVCDAPLSQSLEVPVVLLGDADGAWAQEYLATLTQAITVDGVRAYVEQGETFTEDDLRGASLMYLPEQRVLIGVSTVDVDLSEAVLESVTLTGGA